MTSSLVNPLTYGFAEVAVHFVFCKKENIDREKDEGMSKYKAMYFNCGMKNFRIFSRTVKKPSKLTTGTFREVCRN